MGGVGSSKLLISATSIDIHNLLILDNNRNTCNVELRPKGIILRSTEYGYKIKNRLRLTIGSRNDNLKFMRSVERIFGK